MRTGGFVPLNLFKVNVAQVATLALSLIILIYVLWIYSLFDQLPIFPNNN